MKLCILLPFLLLTSAACAADKPHSGNAAYQAEIAAWQKHRAEGLLREDGWLSLAGLFWLRPGSNTVGSAEDARIQLPASAPKHLGELRMEGGRVTFVPEAGGAVPGALLNGSSAAGEKVLADDSTGKPDVISYRTVRLFVIKRAERYGVRVKDSDSSYRKQFKGLNFYAVDPKMRIVADWVAYDPPKVLKIPTIIGTTEEMPAPGRAEFTLQGKRYSLEPVVEPGSDELFFIMKDLTAEKETYGAGRFLYTDMPKDGKVVLDFNKAQNPPCAYTPYATCPLPPKQNQLQVAIRAGEKIYSRKGEPGPRR